jgi:hypothetical protein
LLVAALGDKRAGLPVPLSAQALLTTGAERNIVRAMLGTRVRRGTALWLLSLAFFLLSFSSPAHAQFWKKKDYTDWSQNDCRKILTNSPWTKTYSSSAMEMPNGAQGSMVPGRQPLMTLSYTAQFFSALPVRMAQVRMGQIQAHYNKMTPAQKKAFDANAARYLAVRFPRDTIIRVVYSTNIDSARTSLQNFWQLMSTAKLLTSVYLSVDGKTVRLARFQGRPQEQAFFLFFPRMVDGKPLLDPSHKSVSLQIGNPSIEFQNGFGSGSVVASPAAAGTIHMEFNVKKMIFNGKVAY